MIIDGTATEQEVPAAIEILMDHGFVVDASAVTGPSDVYQMWWRDHLADGSLQVAIAVVGVGEVPTAEIGSAISAHNLVITSDSSCCCRSRIGGR